LEKISNYFRILHTSCTPSYISRVGQYHIHTVYIYIYILGRKIHGHTCRVCQYHIYIRCMYGNYGREITKYTVIHGAYVRFWPALHIPCTYTVLANPVHTYWALMLRTHTHAHTHTHTHARTHTYTNTHTCTHTHTHTHTYTHTYTHAHTHTHTQKTYTGHVALDACRNNTGFCSSLTRTALYEKWATVWARCAWRVKGKAGTGNLCVCLCVFVCVCVCYYLPLFIYVLVCYDLVCQDH